jgi:hypothetical protein
LAVVIEATSEAVARVAEQEFLVRLASPAPTPAPHHRGFLVPDATPPYDISNISRDWR